MRIRTDFPYATTRADVRVPLADGTRLYARIWRPETDRPVPALLEYAPDRLTDASAARDAQRHPWYAGHGYASVRVDVRGHGNSEGLPGEPHDAQELADGVAVVEWLARRPWCDGGVGMFGIGWGGVNSLRIAALAPEPLKAVVTVCSSDDLHDNDGPYLGGSVLAEDMHGRSAALLARTALPPDPAHVGAEWREMWPARLAALRPALHTWLGHQTRDAHWRSHGLREEYGRIRAAVLAVGGWCDPGRDTVLRLVAELAPDRVRGLIGPWARQYPDRELPPGPAIGFLQESLRWWDQWLGGRESGVLDEPRLRSWLTGSYRPAPRPGELPGRWVGDPAWPSPHVAPVVHALGGGPVRVGSPQHTGMDAGPFRPAGEDADLAPDQRAEDAYSAAFDFAVPHEGPPVEVLGRPEVTLRLRMDVPFGQVAARLCDVAPDGSSTLVTRGALNLSAREGADRADAWPLGATLDVTFPLGGAGHCFPPGHRVRLAVSSAYWPWLWPQADSVGFTLEPAGSSLTLPLRGPTRDALAFAPPEQSAPLGVAAPEPLDEPRPRRLVVRDVARGEWRLEVEPGYGGTRVHPDGLEHTEEGHETYTVDESDPLSARARAHWTVRLHRPELGWDVTVTTRSEISCDAADFITSDEVVCRDGDEVVFHRTWEQRLPRTAG
ncbi:CocE/NonD family hydrolase [Streptomyces sp. cg36]|uniref:CocE/NonD family hydrolase n=1 Tax=Streptomyces sp. cg36 TaxID=3238798 RepID=UPI0034E1C631